MNGTNLVIVLPTENYGISDIEFMLMSSAVRVSVGSDLSPHFDALCALIHDSSYCQHVGYGQWLSCLGFPPLVYCRALA